MTNRRATLTCVAAAASVAVFASACTSSTSGDTGATSAPPGSTAAQGASGSATPSGGSTPGTAPKAIPGAINGLVVDKGTSVAHARIKVVIAPSTRAVGALKRGKKVAGKVAAVAVSTMPDGKYTARIDRRLVTAKYRDGATITVEIFVLSPKGNAVYAIPVTLVKGRLQGVSAVFDLGAKTIAVNGASSPLVVF